jgi:hypothetical protein
MNIQIGTAYATACDVNWTIILVDASYFLKADYYFPSTIETASMTSIVLIMRFRYTWQLIVPGRAKALF